MDFIKCVEGRRSIRKFTKQKVEHEKFEKIVSIASFSPSWKNTQIVRYTLIEDKQIIDNIADNCVMGFKFNSDTIKNAPALILVTMISGRCGYEKDGSFSTSKEDRWEMFDAGIATQTLCLAAHSEGLGTIIMGIFDEKKLHEAAGVEENQKIAAIVGIGYPDENPAIPKRKNVDELISYK